MTLDPESAEIHTSGYIIGLDYNLLLSYAISCTQGSESSLGLNYHSHFSLGENNSVTDLQRNICVLCILYMSVYYVYISIFIYMSSVSHE